MRKLVFILLTSVFLFNTGGYYLWFSVLKQNIHKEIRQEIEKGLKEKDLSLIIVSESNKTGICWTKPDKEFKYKGEMYDVVKVKIKNQKKYYYCINDSKENRLIAHFDKSKNARKRIEKIVKRTHNPYFPLQFSLSTNNYASNFRYVSIDIFYSSNIVDTLSPPPKST